MSVSTDGQICYGICIGEDYELPWDNDRFDNGIEDWWIYEVCKYKNPIEIFNDQGDYINGKPPSTEDLNLYYKFKRGFIKSHPIPVELVDACSDSQPMYIVTVPETVHSASRGCPVVFEPKDLAVTEEQHNKLVEFCKNYIDYFVEEKAAKWYLSSYWG